MITALASGAFLGLSCGLASGPLLALLLAQTFRHGPREGCKIALTPLVTDLPIILVTLALASKLAQLSPLLGILSIAGGAFVLFLAWESLRPVRQGSEASAEPPRSWFKGIVTNLLNPHPWIFCLTVGAAIFANSLITSSIFVDVGQLMADAKLAEVPPGAGLPENAGDERLGSGRGRATDHVCMFNEIKPTLRRHID